MASPVAVTNTASSAYGATIVATSPRFIAGSHCALALLMAAVASGVIAGGPLAAAVLKSAAPASAAAPRAAWRQRPCVESCVLSTSPPLLMQRGAVLEKAAVHNR